MKFSDFLIVEEKFLDSPLNKTISLLEKEEKVLLLTTSNRSASAKERDDIPKSTQLAKYIQSRLGMIKCQLIDVTELNILNCVGNVSSKDGNQCGLKGALLKNKEKNPSGYHRCWVSYSHKNDELWKITKPLFESNAVVFFGSVRWGQMNAYYQKLIERLTWIENRHTTLGEDNVVKKIKAGVIAVGQQWNGEEVVSTQKQVLDFFGFKVPDELFWNWQYSDNKFLETKKSYINGVTSFNKLFKLNN
jgi:multimeric flavodoxin WrbA